MKRAIIIGATSGIGNELAKLLVQHDYLVGITGRRVAELEKLKRENSGAYFISSFDCTTANNAEKLTELTNQMGGLDLLILSSGTGDLNENLDFEIEHNTNLLNVNAFTQIVDWAFNYFQAHGKGHLVAISSIAGIRGSRLAPAYNASKAYQINYLEGLRQKATKSKKPIFITDIRPGFVDTDMAKGDGQFWVASKEKAARQIFGIIKRKKGIGYVTKRWWIVAKILRLIPSWVYRRM
ncbi:SDR family NAD(P)-dependent oxidoreductase [Gilvibacter sediminis]|uniref:SDR family NAD(P)-dependent oxidoreductase n=1 Tax=Gilvibacter sediminis TaxID=379071 RepID=UPI002350538F|nr:SDR family NAD(P)-dependent oxidoreductase [Gilvibacter sediminis]MDC7998952.1 SDR family NAD(P)-dependent oxidoreductase [Gilvibacter sediminis]